MKRVNAYAWVSIMDNGNSGGIASRCVMFDPVVNSRFKPLEYKREFTGNRTLVTKQIPLD